MRVAHDVAQAVQCIEGLASEEAAIATASPVKTIDARAQSIQDLPAAMVAAPVIANVEPIVVGPPVREHQTWNEAEGAVSSDPRRSFAGRGLAHDPGFDDAGSIAARYAPTQRPR